MRCFRRSTRSFASCTVLLVLATTPLEGRAATPSLDAVSEAMTAAVHARVGRGATVAVEGITGLRMTTAARSLVAVPDPSAQVGAPVRFVLPDGASGRSRGRVGEATAVVRITAPAVHARRAIARGARLAADDVALAETDLDGRPLRPLLALETVVGGRGNTDFKGTGTTTRAGELSALMTARVSDLLPNGDMVVEGVREIEINGDRQIVVLTGVVRAADVDRSNLVLSTSIGQLRIRYFGRGLIKDNLKPGWLIRALNKVF